MIIPLFLFEKKLLHAPMFYLSEYLEAHDEEYKNRLLGVSRDDDWTAWCVFFLQALRKQSAANESRTREILSLYEAKKRWIIETTHSQHAIAALDYLFNFPIFSSTNFIAGSDVPPPTGRRMLALLAESDLIRVIRPGRGRRPTVFAFAELVNIAEGRKLI
jgi:Fic family protein